MSAQTSVESPARSSNAWLKNYYYLRFAVTALLRRNISGPQSQPAAPDVSYEMIGDPERWADY